MVPIQIYFGAYQNSSLRSSLCSSPKADMYYGDTLRWHSHSLQLRNSPDGGNHISSM